MSDASRNQIAAAQSELYDAIGEKTEEVSGGIRRIGGHSIGLPLNMGYHDAIAQLTAAQDDEGTVFSRDFPYRPFDGAYAAQMVMEQTYGVRGIGTGTETMFGKTPPSRVSVPVAPGQHVSVPWQKVTFPPLSTVFNFDMKDSPEKGAIFSLSAQTKGENEPIIEKFFDKVEEYLRSHSIYRGKAIDGAVIPEFLDLAGVDEGRIVYSTQTQAELQANVWSPIIQSDRLRGLGVSMKRSILLDGPYGTGKTLAAFKTARLAVEHGWTFIYCRPQDNFAHTMATARLYAPCVVFFEDLDRIADSSDPEKITALLDVMDGLAAKPADVMTVATTNNKDRIHKGMWRPGRIDAFVHIGKCDAESAEKILRTSIPENLVGDMDLAPFAASLVDMTPAFVREAAERAIRYAITRTGGSPESINKDDLTAAVAALSAHYALMEQAHGDSRPSVSVETELGALIERAVHNTLHGTQWVDPDFRRPMGYSLDLQQKATYAGEERK